MDLPGVDPPPSGAVRAIMAEVEVNARKIGQRRHRHGTWE
jgi:hypothetical protein